MAKPNAAPPIEISEPSEPFVAGYGAGRAALVGLAQLGPESPERLQWLSGFFQAFVEASKPPSATTRSGEEPALSSSRNSRVPLSSNAALPYTARITGVDVIPACNGETWLNVSLDVEGGQLTYMPGSTLALWPSNEPEEVRKVLRALGVSAQLPVKTLRGLEPAWQVLLERVSLTAISFETLELLEEYSRSESEAQGLFELRQSSAASIQNRSLLSVLRRFPSTRPPLDRLLTTLKPLEPSLVPIASSAADTPTRLQFMANIVAEPCGLGELGLAAKSKLREGEWVTVSIDGEREPLPVKDALSPVIIIAEGPCIAMARALVAERRVQQAKGRNWLICLGLPTTMSPLAREFRSWHQSMGLGRYDAISSVEPNDMLRLLEEVEDILWRWVVDHSQLCVVTTKLGIRQAFEEWLTALIARRQRLDLDVARLRIMEFRDNQRLVELPRLS